jgi:hypothetical protein
MNALAKILELTGKYAWVVFLATCAVLFMPDDMARQTGIYEFRQMAGGALRVIMAFTAIVSLAFLLNKKAITGWLKKLRDRAQRELQEKKDLHALVAKLGSLDSDERMWIKYCLYHNTQTLSADCRNQIAQSLHRKAIVEEGTGHILALPFAIPDRLWRYLLKHQDEFMSAAEVNDERFLVALENFRKSLGPGIPGRKSG